jgi:hypothetical protein
MRENDSSGEVIYMGDVQGPEIVNDTCVKTVHVEMIDRGFTVVPYLTDYQAMQTCGRVNENLGSHGDYYNVRVVSGFGTMWFCRLMLKFFSEKHAVSIFRAEVTSREVEGIYRI